MKLMNKIKGILFDEDEIEETEEVEEMSKKETKKLEKKMSGGIIEHHHDNIEEDTIQEIIVPHEELEKIDDNKFNLVDDETMDRDFPTREKLNHDLEEDSFKEFDDLFREDRNIARRSTDDVRKEYNIASPIKKHTEEIKDYKKMLETPSAPEKKPFKVTPVISPVYGVLDKNYTADNVAEKRELINKTNSGVKVRTFGPVSYNDEPIKKVQETSLKEDLVEMNTTINELIDDAINPHDINVNDIEIPETSVETINSEEDAIIQTENYDDYETTSIENEYSKNTNIEDAFESTEEFNAITENDKKVEAVEEIEQETMPEDTSIEEDEVEEYTPLEETEEKEDIEEFVEENSSSDDAGLDDTIETDLFNLIDSMYKSNDDEGEE